MYQYYEVEYLTYVFVTKNQVEYSIYFKSSPYFLGDESLPYAQYIYEFIIESRQLDDKVFIPLDKRTGETIARILADFYLKFDHSVTVYICDSSDNRQMARKLKFDHWFIDYNTEKSLVKISEELIDEEGVSYPVSMILKYNNPYFLDIIDRFRNLKEDYSK